MDEGAGDKGAMYEGAGMRVPGMVVLG